MALQMSQLQGQILEPPGTLLHATKPQGPATQLLLWQVLQQLQSIEPNNNQCTMLMNELRMEKIRMRQERTRREDFEEEAYKEITKLRNDKKLSGINADGVMLDLQVKNSKLETVEKQLVDERNSRIKLEIESEKCKVKLQQEQELNMLLGTEKEKCEKDNDSRKSLEEEIVKLESQLYEEKMSSLNAMREMKHVQQLEETLKNETMKRLSAEHEYLKQMLELKNEISILTGLQDMAENSKKLCDVAQAKLKDELGNLRTDLFKLNVELVYEKKAVVELKEGLIKEVNYGKRLKDELDFKTNKVTDLGDEIKLIKKELLEERAQKDNLEKKLEVGQIDLRKENDQVMKLKKDLENEAQRIKNLEKKLEILNGTGHEIQFLGKKLQDLTRDLNVERNETKTLKQKLEYEAMEIRDLKKKLEIERDIGEQEKERRKFIEKELEIVKHLYVKCGPSDGFSPLHRACKVCDISEAKSLMRNGHSASEESKGNSTWKTSVHLAVAAGCIDLVHLFALNKTLLNIWDENGATPLHEAAQYPNTNVVRVLVDNGAAINAWDKFGKTPLDYAGSSSNTEVMKLLIDRGAALGSAREFGSTTQRIDDYDYRYNYYY